MQFCRSIIISTEREWLPTEFQKTFLRSAQKEVRHKPHKTDLGVGFAGFVSLHRHPRQTDLGAYRGLVKPLPSAECSMEGSTEYFLKSSASGLALVTYFEEAFS